MAGAPPVAVQHELQPATDQLQSLSYCIESPPPWREAFVLGFQHYLVTVSALIVIPTALVVPMGGGAQDTARVIQSLLLVAGLNTLAQTAFGTRLPAVIGGSYSMVAPTLSLIMSGRYTGIWNPHERFERSMRGIQGSLIIASALQIILGFSGLWGKVNRFLSPLAAVPLVALVGFGSIEIAFPRIAKCVEIGLPALIVILIFSQYVPRHTTGFVKSLFHRFAILFSVAFVWVYAHLLTVGGAYNTSSETLQFSCRTDRSGLISAAPWVAIPYPFQWGAPIFDMGDIVAMTIGTLVTLVESTGTFIAITRLSSATPLPPSILSRGIGWQGIGILLSGLFGTLSGSTVAVENAGLLGVTRVGSRRVVQISAGFMILFSIFGKFGAVIASIPAPIVAALYCLFFAHVGSAGLSFLQFCNLNSSRVKFILGFSVFMGLSIPHYFRFYQATHGVSPVDTSQRWFNNMIVVPCQSEAFIGGLLAFFLDLTLFRKDSTAARKDRGMHWWDRFRTFNGDQRSEEFYSLPFNLNKFFPPV